VAADALNNPADGLKYPADAFYNPAVVTNNPADALKNPADVLNNPAVALKNRADVPKDRANAPKKFPVLRSRRAFGRWHSCCYEKNCGRGQRSDVAAIVFEIERQHYENTNTENRALFRELH
jgi:hypothetical protein